MFYSQLSGRSCFITHTVMRRKFTFILRVLSEQRKTTALRRLKQTGGGWGCCRSHVAAFGRWMEQHKTSSFSCLFFYRKLTNCQKEQKHLIMCHYKVSYRAPF